MALLSWMRVDAGDGCEPVWALTAYPGSGNECVKQVMTGWDCPGLGVSAKGVEPVWRGPLVGSFWLVASFGASSSVG